MTVALGQAPASALLTELAWPTGTITLSVLGEPDMPGFVLCDGRRIDKTGVGADLYALIGHAYELTPGVDPGDGKFRLPPFVQNSANGSQARMPIGQDPSGPAALQNVGGQAGVLGHTHGPGSFALADHGHAPGTLGAPDHTHGHNLGANHGHSLYNDSQRIAQVCSGCNNYTGAVEYAFGGGNPWYLVNAANPGIGPGATGGSQHGLAIAGSSGLMSEPQPWVGVTAAEDPAYLSALVYVKL